MGVRVTFLPFLSYTYPPYFATHYILASYQIMV